MKNKPAPIFLVLLLLASNLQAQSRQFYIRTLDSSSVDFESFISTGHKLSYVDWILFHLKNKKFQSTSLDRALEMAATRPLDSLPLFEISIREIQAEILNEDGRQLLLSIYEKIAALELPAKIHQEYLSRAKNMQELHGSIKAQSKGHLDEVHKKDVALTLDRIAKIKALEQFVILVNGELLSNVLSNQWPQGEQQWAVISNSYETVLMVGTWSEFQQHLQGSEVWKPLAEGNCQASRILSTEFEVQTNAALFISKNCKALESDDNESSQIRNQQSHLGTVSGNLEPDRKWSWVLPLGLVLTAGLFYSLKDKRVTVKSR